MNAERAAGRPITPRRSTTRRFHTVPDTWDEERIAAALRDWTKEVGIPPRSYEWCPGSARPAGLIGPEDSKWEREHPRWPGNTTVYRYFDSWAAALEAAGIEPIYPAGPEGSVAERVEAAMRMHIAGESNRSIAEVLGVQPETVSRYLRARPCGDCGGPVVGTAKLCHICATRRGNPMRWSKEEVIEAVHMWVRLERRTPTVADWRPMRFGGSRRWEAEFPAWPPARLVRSCSVAGIGCSKQPRWASTTPAGNPRRSSPLFVPTPSGSAGHRQSRSWNGHLPVFRPRARYVAISVLSPPACGRRALSREG